MSTPTTRRGKRPEKPPSPDPDELRDELRKALLRPAQAPEAAIGEAPAPEDWSPDSLPPEPEGAPPPPRPPHSYAPRQEPPMSEFEYVPQQPKVYDQPLGTVLWPENNAHGPTCRLIVFRAELDGTRPQLGSLSGGATVEALLAQWPRPGRYLVQPVAANGQPIADELVHDLPDDHQWFQQRKLAQAAGLPAATVGALGSDALLQILTMQHAEATRREAALMAELAAARDVAQAQATRHAEAEEARAMERLALAEQGADRAVNLHEKLVDLDSKRQDRAAEAERTAWQKQIDEQARAHQSTQGVMAQLHETMSKISADQVRSEQARLDLEKARILADAAVLQERAREREREAEARYERQRAEDAARIAEQRRQDREHQRLVLELYQKQADAKTTAGDPLSALAPLAGLAKFFGIDPKEFPGLLRGEQRGVVGELVELAKEYLRMRTTLALGGANLEGAPGLAQLLGAAQPAQIEEREEAEAPPEQPGVQLVPMPVQPAAGQAQPPMGIWGGGAGGMPPHMQAVAPMPMQPQGVPAAGQAQPPAGLWQAAQTPISYAPPAAMPMQPMGPMGQPPAPAFVPAHQRPAVKALPTETQRKARGALRALMGQLLQTPPEQYVERVVLALAACPETADYLQAASIYAAAIEAGASPQLAETLIAQVDKVGVVPAAVPRR